MTIKTDIDQLVVDAQKVHNWAHGSATHTEAFGGQQIQSPAKLITDNQIIVNQAAASAAAAAASEDSAADSAISANASKNAAAASAELSAGSAAAAAASEVNAQSYASGAQASAAASQTQAGISANHAIEASNSATEAAAAWTAALAANPDLNPAIRMNPSAIHTDTTIPAGYNAVSVGPIEIATSTHFTVSQGAHWTVI